MNKLVTASQGVSVKAHNSIGVGWTNKLRFDLVCNGTGAPPPAIFRGPWLLPTNQDFPCPAWKIAIGSLTTSALAALARYLPTASTILLFLCPPTAPIMLLLFLPFFSFPLLSLGRDWRKKLLRIMDERASYCVYATNNGNSTIWFPF